MTLCDDLLARLAAEEGGEIPSELADHVRGCAGCREALARVNSVAEASSVLQRAAAPSALIERIKQMPRLAPACEEAQLLLGDALDGELDDDSRTHLVDHLHECESCRATWEAFATLREVGSLTVARPPLQARLRLHPRLHVASRRRPAGFNLRLATAAVYLIAALTIMVLGNPATVARASNTGIERAQLYTRAAVENRIDSWTRRGRETIAAAEGWAKQQAGEAWSMVRRLLPGKSANQMGQNNVGKGGDGGTS